MTFPLKLHGHTFDDAPSFAEAVLSDAIAGGGRIKADTLPRTWLGVLATPSDDQRPLLVSLTAWLTRCDNAAGICEAVAIAKTYALHELATVFAAALDGLGLGLLLQPNPNEPGLSVEDTLLKGLAAITNGTPDALRIKLLGHLRHAGLREEELSVLTQFGTKEELVALMPDLIAEALPNITQLRAIYSRDQEHMLALAQVLYSAPKSYRLELWRALIESTPLIKANTQIEQLLTS